MARSLAAAVGAFGLVCAAAVLGVRGTPVFAQQANPPEVSVPQSFGALKTATGDGVYFFEAADGTIRRVVTVRTSGTWSAAVTMIIHRN